MTRRPLLLLAALTASTAMLAACGGTTSGGGSTTASGSPSGSGSASVTCTPESLQTLKPGTLTIGTDKPAYPPYFVDDDPSNGKGFESAVAYAVADKLGYAKDKVSWVVVPFDKSFAPGAKTFDFDINQVSITPERAKAVDFSDGYYTVNQAVVALKGSAGANAKTVADLQKLKLGAQVGTTSLTYVNDVVKPEQQPFVFNSTNDAKSALNNKQIDAIVVDLPTAFYITGAEIPNSVVVGQFKAEQTGGEQFGLVLAKGSSLTQCVNQALGQLTSSGDLQAIQDEWLSSVVKVPFFS